MSKSLGAVLVLLCAAILAHSDSAPAVASPLGPPGTIGTFAGGYNGDGGPATNATIRQPRALAIAPNGDLYTTDTQRCRVRKISGSTISTVLGNGDCGTSPDGGVAAKSVASPMDIAVGGDGTLYFTEQHGGPTNNCLVRKVSAGLIVTIAGNGACEYTAATSGPATSLPLYGPRWLDVDASGNVYVVGYNDCRVWKISNGMLSHFAGAGCLGSQLSADPLLATFYFSDIAVDAAGSNVYVAEATQVSPCRIRRISGGVVSLFAGSGTCGIEGDGGFAVNASIYPLGISVDSAGNVAMASVACRVRVVSGGLISTVAACTDGLPGNPPVDPNLSPGTVGSIGPDEIWIGGMCRISKLDGGLLSHVAGVGSCEEPGGDGLPATAGTFDHPAGVLAGQAGEVYVLDPRHCRTWVVAADGEMNTVAGRPCLEYTPPPPPGVPGRATESPVQPTSSALAPNGELLIVDNACVIRKIADGMITTVAGNYQCGSSGLYEGAPTLTTPLGGVRAIAARGSEFYFVRTCAVWRITADHAYRFAGHADFCDPSAGDGGPAIDAELDQPVSIVFDAAGGLLIAEESGCRVRRVYEAVITTSFGDGVCATAGDGGSAKTASLNQPSSLAFDSHGNLYVSQTADCRVRRIRHGIIQTIAGTGQCVGGGPMADGELAVSAPLATPSYFNSALTLDAAGNLFISNSGSDSVRIVYGYPDADNDGCSDGDENGADPKAGGDRSASETWDFFDVTMDQRIDLLDTLAILDHFGAGTAAPDYLQVYDRYAPDPAKPWRTAAAANGIDLIDALVNLDSFGHSCAPTG